MHGGILNIKLVPGSTDHQEWTELAYSDFTQYIVLQGSAVADTEVAHHAYGKSPRQAHNVSKSLRQGIYEGSCCSSVCTLMQLRRS